MATIKAYTDFSQSKTLSKILPIESADMIFVHTIDLEGDEHYDIDFRNQNPLFEDDVCAWSLAALYHILPNTEHTSTTLSRGGWKIEPVEYIDKWFCEYEDEVDEDSPSKNFSVSADNPVDACVAMIEKLNKLNLL